MLNRFEDPNSRNLACEQNPSKPWVCWEMCVAVTPQPHEQTVFLGEMLNLSPREAAGATSGPQAGPQGLQVAAPIGPPAAASREATPRGDPWSGDGNDADNDDGDDDDENGGDDDPEVTYCDPPEGFVRIRPSQFNFIPGTVFVEYPPELGEICPSSFSLLLSLDCHSLSPSPTEPKGYIARIAVN
jgi:hypothetical protein